jgi:hypothetical protein
LRKIILTHYQTTLLGRLFAKHGKFTSFDILENKLSIRKLLSKKEIPFLAVDTITITKGSSGTRWLFIYKMVMFTSLGELTNQNQWRLKKPLMIKSSPS